MRAIILGLMLATSAASMAAGPTPPKGGFAPPQEPTKLELQRIPLSQLIHLVYTEVLKGRQYIIDSSVTSADDIISVRLESKKPEGLRHILQIAMAERGIFVTETHGIDVIQALPDFKRRLMLAEHVIVYRPKHRSADYLRSVLGQFVPMTGATSSYPVVSAPPAPAAAAGGSASATSTQNGAPAPAAAAAASMVRPTASASPDLVVVQASSKQEERKLRDLIASIDLPADQVSVEAVLFEVGLDSGGGSGVAAALDLLRSRIKLSIGDPGQAGNFASVELGGLQAILKIFGSDGRFRTLSSTSLTVRSGESAKLQVGSEVPVLGAVTYSNTGQQAVQSVEYRPSGIMLSIQPQVREHSIELSISQQISEFVQTTTGVNSSPTKQTRDLQTALTVTSGQTAFLGGLTSSRTSSASNTLWRWNLSEQNSTNKSELLLVVRVQKLKPPAIDAEDPGV